MPQIEATSLLLKSCEDVGFLNDQVVFAFYGNFGTAVLAVDHHVANLDFHGNGFAVFVLAARADCDNLTLHGLFLGVIRDEEAGGGLLFGFGRLYNDSDRKSHV